MEEKELKNKKSTTVYGGSLSIMKFENGVRIKKRNQGKLILDDKDAGELALVLRTYSYPKLYTSVQLNAIKKKFKDNEEVCSFVDRVLKNELKYEEL